MRYTYRVVLEKDSTPAVIQNTLNACSGEGFRCVHFQLNHDGSWTFIFEAEVREYLVAD
jgi:hypothetical protein